MKKAFYTLFLPSAFILIWSSGYLFVEEGLQDNGPMAYLMLRYLIASAAVFLIFLLQGAKFPASWKELAQMIITGIFFQVIYIGAFFIALEKHMPAGILAIILGMQPIAIALLLREPLRLIQRWGLFIGFVGLILTVSDSIFAGAITEIGMLAAIISLFGITIGTMLQKKYCSEMNLTTNILVQYLVSALVFSSLYFAEGAAPIKWTEGFIVCVFWVALVMSVVAFFLFCSLLKKGKAASISSLLYCIPPLTAAMDFLTFHRTLPMISVLGMVLVILSLILIHKKPIKES